MNLNMPELPNCTQFYTNIRYPALKGKGISFSIYMFLDERGWGWLLGKIKDKGVEKYLKDWKSGK